MLSSAHSQQIVRKTREWIGTPYQHQASLKGVGCDCLGLVRAVWREVYGAEPERVPPYSADWAESGRQENLADAAFRHMVRIDNDDFEPSDVLIFRWRPHVPAKHLAIVSSPTSMIHAQEGVAVCEVNISPWWRRHIAYACRFPQLDLALFESDNS